MRMKEICGKLALGTQEMSRRSIQPAGTSGHPKPRAPNGLEGCPFQPSALVDKFTLIRTIGEPRQRPINTWRHHHVEKAFHHPHPRNQLRRRRSFEQRFRLYDPMLALRRRLVLLLRPIRTEGRGRLSVAGPFLASAEAEHATSVGTGFTRNHEPSFPPGAASRRAVIFDRFGATSIIKSAGPGTRFKAGS
jgi:hypothetical protein